MELPTTRHINNNMLHIKIGTCTISNIPLQVGLGPVRVFYGFIYSQSDQNGNCSSTRGDVSRIAVGEKLEVSWAPSPTPSTTYAIRRSRPPLARPRCMVR